MSARAMLLIACAACVLPGDLSVQAGEFNEVLSIGDVAPAWQDLPGTDGKTHSLSDLKDKTVVVVVFTCASCPTAVDYEARIAALARKHADQVAVVAICVNQVEADQLPALTQRAQEQKFNFDYLSDASQKIARDYGAVFTPEFYVLNRDRKIVYMGAMDDSTNADDVQARYVEDAVQAALAGTDPEVKEVIARGCRVRYAKERRKAK
ncbi:thioredoxin family protein [Planctomicrobium sp. SH661]|uniref:thioredoxin family protein n=1 Tax=Planctomicrobium sp. SH661 TaxID=3448124 RepID=UPI003F5C9E40